MDRLDTWVSAQRGWRLLLVRCVLAAPLGLGAGAMWSWVTLDPVATPQVRALFARVALCEAASFLLAALTLLPPAWRGPVRRSDRILPVWRMIAAYYSFFGSFLVSAYADAEPLAWRQHHRWIVPVQLALFGLYLAMFAWHLYYLRRLRRRREQG